MCLKVFNMMRTNIHNQLGKDTAELTILNGPKWKTMLCIQYIQIMTTK